MTESLYLSARPTFRETPMRAEPIRSGLRPQTLGRSGILGAQNVRALILTAGSATLMTPAGDEVVQAPVFVWTPWNEGARLTIAPGSQGSHLVLGAALLSKAVRHNPHAADLGYLAERRYVLTLRDMPEVATILANSFQGLVAETRETMAMSESLVEAHLSIMLVSLYRALKAGPDALELHNRMSPLASRFIALVEAHLQERWTVAVFCEALDVTREQLTATCLRSFGRPPGLMIRQRTTMEARRLLEQSTLTVDQIAQRLGFTSSPQFNRFFSGFEGIPPGRYRRQFVSGRRTEAVAGELHAWP